MSESRLKIKFGEYEFEAEGSAESVERHWESFKKLVAPETEPPPAIEMMRQSQKENPPAPLELDRIMRTQGRIVSLGVSAKIDDAVLLLLLGQGQLRQTSIISGAEIMGGLRESGFRIQRADNILARHAAQGNIIAIGRFRTRRYQLSKVGFERGQQIARQLISQVQ